MISCVAPEVMQRNARSCCSLILAQTESHKRLSALPDELAVACFAPRHVLKAFHGSARFAPAVADDRSHAFLSVECLMPVMAMQRVDEPIAGVIKRYGSSSSTIVTAMPVLPS
jgi:hypothetical protein